MRFAKLDADTLRIESAKPPTGIREPEHIHPRQESGDEVSSGALEGSRNMGGR